MAMFGGDPCVEAAGWGDREEKKGDVPPDGEGSSADQELRPREKPGFGNQDRHG